MCAVVTIFFAVKLKKAELPDWFDWILVAFVAFHVAMHIILSVSVCGSNEEVGEDVEHSVGLWTGTHWHFWTILVYIKDF